jgi:hypothetical protein
MRRLFFVATAVALLLAIFAPAALAARSLAPDSRAGMLAAVPSTETGSLLVAVDRAVVMPAGDHLDTLVVVGADASVSGDVGTIVIARGTATLTGASAHTLVVVDGHAALEAGTAISGDVRTVNGTVTQAPGATVAGSTSSLDSGFTALAWLLVPFAILLFLGFALAGLAAALFVAAFAARQVRSMEALISGQPGQVLVAGIAASVLLPAIAILLMLTVVGAPIGIAVLFVALPAMAFLAWLVAAIWVGDWIVARSRGAVEPERPYLAAVTGVIVLAVVGIVPFVSAIATLFGFGALVLAGWRTLRREVPGAGAPSSIQPSASAS